VPTNGTNRDDMSNVEDGNEIITVPLVGGCPNGAD
jgi:hypothetical protein